MVIVDKLKALRDEKNLSQGDLEKRCATSVLHFAR